MAQSGSICGEGYRLDPTPIRSYDDLIEVARRRMMELLITYETLDAVSGVQSGYGAKLLCPGRIKTFGPMSFCAIMGALGIKLVAVEDPEAVARLRHRWTPRQAPRANWRTPLDTVANDESPDRPAA
jgi:hypothetical protein